MTFHSRLDQGLATKDTNEAQNEVIAERRQRDERTLPPQGPTLLRHSLQAQPEDALHLAASIQMLHAPLREKSACSPYPQEHQDHL